MDACKISSLGWLSLLLLVLDDEHSLLLDDDGDDGGDPTIQMSTLASVTMTPVITISFLQAVPAAEWTALRTLYLG